MGYSVKEVYFTLQGEGHHTGRQAVFLRFAGCNLWSGREVDRRKAVCKFCDTDFFGTDGPGGGKFTSAVELADHVLAAWHGAGTPYVVCTGGEPLLQMDDLLVNELQRRNFEVGIETNGTLQPPGGIDWTCVSPKADAELVLKTGDELKLVYPQTGAEPALFEALNFRHFYIQPMDGLDLDKNTAAAATFCYRNPKWKLSLQTHKLLGIP